MFKFLLRKIPKFNKPIVISPNMPEKKCFHTGKKTTDYEVFGANKAVDRKYSEMYFECELCKEPSLAIDAESVMLPKAEKPLRICTVCFYDKLGTCGHCRAFALRSEMKHVMSRDVDCEMCKNCQMSLERCTYCGRVEPKGRIKVIKHKNKQHAVCGNCRDTFFNTKLPYHRGGGRKDLTNGARYRIGIEVEKEDAVVLKEFVCHAGPFLKETEWVIEGDSSLDAATGFEAISPILPLFDKPTLDKYIKYVEPIINAHQSDSCGGHIHLSDAKRTPEQLFANIRGYLALLYSMYPGRIRRGHSAAKKFNAYRKGEHQQGINITQNKTLEFRIFPSPRNIPNLEFRLDLLRHMMLHPAKSPEDVYKQLTTDSALYKLLSRVYDEKDEYLEKVDLFCEYALKYEEVMLDADKLAEFGRILGSSNGMIAARLKRAQDRSAFRDKEDTGEDKEVVKLLKAEGLELDDDAIKQISLRTRKNQSSYQSKFMEDKETSADNNNSD